MALFKFLKGLSTNLSKQALHEGWMYITEDTGDMYVDTSTKRIQINPHDYALCSTDTATANKVITYIGFVLTPGSKLNVVFSNDVNISAENHFIINDSIDKIIKFNGINPTVNIPYQFIYSGGYFHCQGTTLTNLGVTATSTELNYTKGLVENVQNKLNLLYNNMIFDCTASYSSGVITLTTQNTMKNTVNTIRFTAPNDYLTTDILKINGTTYTLKDTACEALDEGAWKTGAIILLNINTSLKTAYYSTSGGDYIPVFGT